MPCWISVKAEAEMRRSATKESRFIARKMSAGTAIGSELVTSPRATAARLSPAPGSALACRRIIAALKRSFMISPTARMDCELAVSLSTPLPYRRDSVYAEFCMQSATHTPTLSAASTETRMSKMGSL